MRWSSRTNGGQLMTKYWPGRARIFSWDWRELPDFRAMAAAADELSSSGTPADDVYWHEVNTGSDFCVWVIADHEVSNEEAEDRFYSFDGTTAPYWVARTKDSDAVSIVQAPDETMARGQVDGEVTAIAASGTAAARVIAGCQCDPDGGCEICDPAHFGSDEMKYAFDGCASPLELVAALLTAADHYRSLAEAGWQFDEPINVGHVRMHRPGNL